MKKIFVLVLVFMLMGCTVLANEIDISNLEPTELFKLKKAVDEKIVEMFGDMNNLIGPGEYIVGKDIKPGIYVIKPTGVTSYPSIEIYENNENETTIASIRFRSDEVWSIINIILKDGQVLKIENINGILAEIKPSWVP